MRYKEQIRKSLEAIEIRANFLKQAAEGSKQITHVDGLGVLFSGAALSVMVMAGSLEFAKLVAATYLKQKWDEITGFNKWYLVSAVAVLMLITSAGIFGYLSNAFQQQNLKLQQVDREIAVYSTKINTNDAQITQLNTQLGQLSATQNTILDKGKVNNRLLRSIDSKDKQTSQLNKKISDLQTENAKNNDEINKIKVTNLDLEKEVGGFRFVAEMFGVELKKVVKFFIFLIVIVFDPLAVALIIAFNGLIETKKQKQSRLLGEIIENDQKMGLYDDFAYDAGELDDLMEKNYKDYQIYGDNGKKSPKIEENGVIMENIPQNEPIEPLPVPYYEEPTFDWDNKNLWINNPMAVKYWMQNGNSIHKYNKLYRDHLKEIDKTDDLTKKY